MFVFCGGFNGNQFFFNKEIRIVLFEGGFNVCFESLKIVVMRDLIILVVLDDSNICRGIYNYFVKKKFYNNQIKELREGYLLII